MRIKNKEKKKECRNLISETLTKQDYEKNY